MKRLTLLIVAVLALIAMAVPAGALADGDPGSDELVYNNLFYGTAGLTVGQQTQLGNLLYATQALGAPVRVAIIASPGDLGTVSQLWRNPDEYSWYLGTELSLAYDKRVVVVMPNGVAYWWYRHTDGHETGVPLTGIQSGSSPAQLVSAATAAVTRLEAQAGISAAKLNATANSKAVAKLARAAAGSGAEGAIASTATPTAGSGPTATPSATDVSPVVVVVGLLVVLGAVFWFPPMWRRRGVVTRYGIGVPGMAVAVVALGSVAVLAVVVHTNTSSGQNADETLALNPHIATLTSLGNYRKATNFTLTDETGHKISLSQYRGKVVILSFTDAECQTICPLTTQAMVDARDSLGAAKKDVVLLGVNANWKSTSTEDVLSYTELHGLVGQWHFLTGSFDQLHKVWKEYGVAGDIDYASSSLIEHTPAVYLIGPNGNVRDEVSTYSSYAAIPQFGQVLADGVSSILPSHPKVSTHYSYTDIPGISPTAKVSLPKVGGGRLTVGTAKHVYLFFDSWDQQSTAIKGEMPALDAYQTYAKAHGLPTLIAVDEGAVEPNPEAVVAFLKGMKLNYPVVVDTTGRLADGYGVQGEPWFVLTVPSAKNTVDDPTATTPWEQEVYTQGWPTLGSLRTTIEAALHPKKFSSASAAVKKDLAGSPPALVALHRQASRILSGGAAGLMKALRALRGHPVVVNIWASDCTSCQAEMEYFGADSAEYGSKVAFLGIDYDDQSLLDAEGFLDRHHVYYPSFRIGDQSVPSALLPGGVPGTPTTIFFNAKGTRTSIHPGAYQSAAALGSDIQSYALGGS